MPTAVESGKHFHPAADPEERLGYLGEMDTGDLSDIGEQELRLSSLKLTILSLLSCSADCSEKVSLESAGPRRAPGSIHTFTSSTGLAAKPASSRARHVARVTLDSRQLAHIINKPIQ